jgi:hypothetical protein
MHGFRRFFLLLSLLLLTFIACGNSLAGDVASWSPDADDNASAPPDGAPEGMSPGAVNDTMREIMAAVRREQMDRDLARHYFWQVEDGGTTSTPTIIGVGPALTELGNDASGGLGLIGGVTSATTNADVAWYLDDDELYTGASSVSERVTFTGRIAVPTDITDVRIYFGLVSASPLAYTDLAGNSVTGAVLRYATDADGTAFWRTVTSNGSSQTVTTTTAAIASAGYYSARVEMESGVARFYLDDVLIATHTTYVPWPGGGGGGPFPFYGARTLDAGPTGIIRQLYFIKLHFRID